MTDYEKNQKRIEEIVEQLEAGDISLEKNMKLVEEGLKLIKESQDYLEKAELKITKIVEEKEVNFK